MTFFLHLIGDGGGSRTYPHRRDGRQLQIEWKGNYRIDAAAFIFVDRKARGTRTIPGHPTQKLAHLREVAKISNMFG